MKALTGFLLLCCWMDVSSALAQDVHVDPQIVTESGLERKVAVVELAPRFVTTILLSDAVNSVVLGDPSRFQVEHSDKEPRLVFVKTVSTKPAATNLSISMLNGDQVSLLLVSRGEVTETKVPVDFLLRYRRSAGFSVASSGFPFALVGETVPLSETQHLAMADDQEPNPAGCNGIALPGAADPKGTRPDAAKACVQRDGLDKLLEKQKNSPLPTLYGEHITQESVSGTRLRAGVGQVIDDGQQVIVLFSVVNPSKRAISLMPPQVQLAGRTTSGRVARHKRWSIAEQLPVLDFRLTRRRLDPGERADGVMLMERPPYKQSNETLLLQVAEAGAVDRPALAPIGFGISAVSEGHNGSRK